MNVVNIIKCGICGARTNIKTQLGEVNDFYIFVPCLKCKSIINGKCHLDAPYYNFEFDFPKITDCGINDFEYYSECSSELVISKPKILINKEEAHIPVYFKNVDLIGKYMDKAPFYLVSQYLNNLKKEWEKNRNLISLYLNVEYDLLSKMIEESSKEKYKSEVELCFYKHLLYRNTFKFFFDVPSYNLTRVSQEFEKEILDLDVAQLDEVINVMKENDIFNKINYKFLTLTSKIVDKMVYMIPGLTAQFFEKEIDYKEFGISTCTPEQIVEIYKDCYETIATMIPIIEMLNNIKYRGKYNNYININRSVEKSLEDSNGNKIKSLNYDEYFSTLFSKKLNKCIRNSIGHNDYLYDSITQKIIFKDKNIEKEMYLLEFVMECIEIIFSLINVENLFFYLERRKMYSDGQRSQYILTEYNRKFERNEKCACGSGLKFKKCHGNK